MVEYYVPTKDEFQSVVLKEFRFLVDEYGFKESGPIDNNPFLIHYRKDRLIVQIQGYSYGFTTGVDIL
jgi:hypothetical protein